MLNLDNLALLNEHLTTLTRPHALTVLCALSDQELSVEQLSQQLNLSGHHLNQVLMILRKARMISLQKHDAHFVYSISNIQVKQLLLQIGKIYA